MCNCGNTTSYTVCTNTTCQTNNTGCPIKDLSTDCILYTGNDLPCTEIKAGTLLTEVFGQLDTYLCDLSAQLSNSFSLISVGNATRIYKGVDGIGRKEIRSITSTNDIITIGLSEDSQEIWVGIDSPILIDFIHDHQLVPTIDQVLASGNVTDKQIDFIGSPTANSRINPYAVEVRFEEETYTLNSTGLIHYHNTDSTFLDLRTNGVSGLTFQTPLKPAGYYVLATIEDLPAIPNLQQVLDVGSTVITNQVFLATNDTNTNSISVHPSQIIFTKLEDYSQFQIDGTAKSIYASTETSFSVLHFPLVPSTYHTFNLPAKPSGTYTVATVEDLQYSPLELKNEFSGNGIIIRGRNAANYGNIGAGAVDLSFCGFPNTTFGATGESSFASGVNTTASAPYTQAFGVGTTSSGIGSFSAGNGARSFGDYAHSLGNNTKAASFAEATFGSNNTDYTPISTTEINPLDRIFGVGNGTNSASSDAIIILKNGLATLPSVTNALISAEPTGKAIVTKEYLASLAPNGSETKVNSGITTVVSGNGTVATPYVIETNNLQKVITANYVLTSADNNYTIFINNGSTNITVTVPAGLVANFNAGFIQEGTGVVTFVAAGVTLNTATGYVLKGQKYQAYVEKKQSTETFYLLGNVIV